MADKVIINSPATIANLSCGFDVLGVCLDVIGDEIVVSKNNSNSIVITKITGADLPYEIEKNVAGVTAKEMLKALKYEGGIDIEIHKKIKVGSGLGSSASSASGVAVAINELFGKPFSNLELTQYAMLGESIASGSMHADNVAPAIYGNFTLICGYNPLKIVEIKSPEDLSVVVVHPQIEVKTSDARAILPKEVLLKDAISQTGNLAGFIAGLYTEDYQLISDSVKDYLVEPHRKKLIPHFDEICNIAKESGAMATGISGSGPSIFCLCSNIDNAKNVFDRILKIDNLPYQIEVHLSKVNPFGAILKK